MRVLFGILAMVEVITNMCIDSTAIPWHPQRNGSKGPENTKLCRCLCSLQKTLSICIQPKHTLPHTLNSLLTLCKCYANHFILYSLENNSTDMNPVSMGVCVHDCVFFGMDGDRKHPRSSSAVCTSCDPIVITSASSCCPPQAMWTGERSEPECEQIRLL